MTANIRARNLVAASSFVQRAAPIPDHMFFPINDLIKDHPKANPTGISMEDERLLTVHEFQNGSSAAKIFDFVKGHLALITAPACSSYLCCPLRLPHTMDMQLRHTLSEPHDSSW